MIRTPLDDTFPPEAHAPDGTLWWRLEREPGANRVFGDERKIAAFLAYAVGLNGSFTMRELRSALGGAAGPNDAEHLNRRLRSLRTRDSWVILSQKDDGTLGHDEYRVRHIGWHPGAGVDRPQSGTPSEAVRRRVFERDARTCVVCGISAGAPYDDAPQKTARLTLGHRVPGKRLDTLATVDELQTECARCNETVRDELTDPTTLVELLPTVRGLKRTEKVELLSRLVTGRRVPPRIDVVYAESRRLSFHERTRLVVELREMTGSAPTE